MVHKAGLESDAAAAGLGQPMENEQSDDSVPTAQLLCAALEVALARVPGPLVLAMQHMPATFTPGVCPVAH